MKPLPAETASAPDPGYEAKDASVRFAAILGGVLAGLVVLSLLVSHLVYREQYVGREPVGKLGHQTSFTDGPQQQVDIEREWPAIEQETTSHLNGYNWVDRPHGVVRIPIERAMDLVVSEAGKGQSSPAKPKSP